MVGEAGPGSKPGLDRVTSGLAAEAAVCLNLGLRPDEFRGQPRWRRKLILLALALRLRGPRET